MKNLIKETVDVLSSHDLSPVDVAWVGSRDGKYALGWEDFVKIFKNFVYDSGLGRQEIAEDLVVVGDDWWLERHDYDGYEWWEFKKLPIARGDPKPFDRVRMSCQASLDRIMTEEEVE